MEIPLSKSSWEPCGNCEVNSQGYIKKVNDKGILYAVECECHKLWKKETRLFFALKQGGVLTDRASMNYDPAKDSYGNEKQIKMLRNFIKYFSTKYSKLIMYFFGPNGTQKTSLSRWVAKEIAQQGYKVGYVLMQDLIVRLIAANHDNKIFTDYNSCDLLIIDECFDAEKVTVYNSGYQIAFLDTFLRQRLENSGKSTIMISNIHPSSIDEAKFRPSIKQLVTRNTVDKSTVLEFHSRYIEPKNRFNLTDISQLFPDPLTEDE